MVSACPGSLVSPVPTSVADIVKDPGALAVHLTVMLQVLGDRLGLEGLHLMRVVAGSNTSLAVSPLLDDLPSRSPLPLLLYPSVLLRQRGVPLSNVKGRVRVKGWPTQALVALGVGSCRFTSKLQVSVLPAASVALQVTPVVPRGKASPLAGVQVMAGLALQLSVALTV
jgi:hypothetical protein